ncbi:MAG: hypothetical protein ACO1RA_09970 [Planctomycetaceae bacterium]
MNRQTSGERMPGRISPLGTIQEFSQDTQGTVTRGAGKSPLDCQRCF